MQKATSNLQDSLRQMHTGRATVHLLAGVTINYYGTDTSLHQVALVSTPDATTILVKPWDKQLIARIEQAILQHKDNDFVPNNDGETILIRVPALTEERRKNLLRHIKSKVELSRVLIRSIRKDTKDKLKKLRKAGASEDEIKHAETELQTSTTGCMDRIDALLAQKTKEVMNV